ncbi:hypothetical protein [uncultured Eubacterium sp.]|uniref:hypothetical protein n=1 Tax=uncultured Eubacterium sp. TaxID=165185 RepID=UPI002672329B|nr:hypothetical protein [uncultured Eubacterium sp.]
MKKIVGDLLKNRNVEAALQEYYGKFMEINNKYAYIRLAMNYYTYYVMLSESDGIMQNDFKAEIECINDIVEKTINEDTEAVEKGIVSLEKIREDMIKKVRDITCFVDRYNIYEYVLNRIEYRFKETDYPSGYSDENYTRKIMQFILEDEDGMMINSKIKDVIGQLPIRMTKNKFYDMISNGLTIYNDSSKDSVDDFLYMIKTSSMLAETKTMKESYPYLSEAFVQLKNIKFRDLSEEQFNEARDILKQIAAYIDEKMNGAMMIQEIVNDLLLVLYTHKKCICDNIVKACKEIVKDTNLLFMNKFSPKSTEEIEDMFVMLEGEQEQLYPKLSTYDISDEIKSTYSEKIIELNLKDEYDIVYKLPKLNSDSMFVDMNKEENETIAGEAYIEAEKNKLFEEYGRLFKENEKVINRAVMSAALSELPVFFHNISELQDFIYNTLSVCTDKAEKLACIEILNGIMYE